ncbi:MAG: GAF domain-containing protein, partial [Labilithrix sp.]|nr:GAF domain-containing protein [Labilithrix sp.]
DGATLGALVFATSRAADPGPRLEAAAGAVALALAAARARRIGSLTHHKLDRTLGAIHELGRRLARVPQSPVSAFSAPLDDEAAFDVRAFFAELAEQVRDLVGAEMAAVGVGTCPERTFDPWVAVGVPEGMERAVGRHPRPVGTLGVVAVGGATVRLRDVREHPAFVGLPPEHADIRSLLAVPLSTGEESVGNLYLANKRGGEEFDEADEKTVEMFATLAASGFRLSTLLHRSEHDRSRLIQIIAAEPDGVAFVDAASGWILANRAFEDLLGRRVRPEEGARQELGVVCRPDGSALEADDLAAARALRGETTARDDLLLVRHDGTRVPVAERGAPVRSAGGKLLGAVVVLRDVSLQKEVERLREEFAAMVAHDLRNPIQSMLLQLELLRSDAEQGKPTSDAALDRLDRIGARLARMAGDLLDTTRIELSRVPLSRVPLDLAEATRALVDRVRATIGDHAIEVHVTGPLETALVDPTRFDQVLTNLLENAGKYSASGTTVEVEVRAVDDGVEIAVTDRGAGIAPDELPKLFDRFYQAQRARERKSGLGLGLYITKGFVEAHGGRIDVESAVGRGSTFRVWFPRAQPGASPSRDRPAA